MSLWVHGFCRLKNLLVEQEWNINEQFTFVLLRLAFLFEVDLINEYLISFFKSCFNYSFPLWFKGKAKIHPLWSRERKWYLDDKVRENTAEPGLVKDSLVSQQVFNVLKRTVTRILTPYVWFRFQSYPNHCQYIDIYSETNGVIKWFT